MTNTVQSSFVLTLGILLLRLFTKLTSVYGDEALLSPGVFRWFKPSSNGWELIKDDPHMEDHQCQELTTLLIE